MEPLPSSDNLYSATSFYQPDLTSVVRHSATTDFTDKNVNYCATRAFMLIYTVKKIFCFNSQGVNNEELIGMTFEREDQPLTSR